MVAFAFLGNTLFLTILVSMLSNTFSNISSNATAEIQFRKAVLTLEGVKADAVFAYQPPFNILAVFILLPLKFIVSPRWFHKIHVTSVRLLNIPLLLLIAVAERRTLWPSHGPEKHSQPLSKKWFWQKWHLSAQKDILSVFDVPVPDHIQDHVAIDDGITSHMIRRQFQRHDSLSSAVKKRPGRRDSMFSGMMQKMHSSMTATGDDGDWVSKMDSLERKVDRMHGMLLRLLDEDGDAVPDETADQDEAGTSTRNNDGFGLETRVQNQQ